MSNSLTPMMEQYVKIKNQYPDEILFYRLGDFYEMFFDDALKVSKALGLTLTRRSNKTQDIPMCGVPYHVSETYISKLIEQGFKVAICDQVEDPKLAKNLVKREVTRIVTPGTFTDLNYLNSNENNYLMSLVYSDYNVSISYSDYSTGELFTTKKTFISKEDLLSFIIDEIDKVNPSEILLLSKNSKELKKLIRNKDIFVSEVEDSYLKIHSDILITLSDNMNAQLKKYTGEYSSLNLLLNYLGITQKSSLVHLKDIIVYKVEEYMGLDEHTKRNLELIHGLITGTKKGSLFQVLDSTKTAMGSRELKKWIEKPLFDKGKIADRLNLVEELKENLILIDKINGQLNQINDIERLSFKISNFQISPKEIKALANSFSKIKEIKKEILNSNCIHLKNYVKNVCTIDSLIDEINTTLISDPPHIIDDKRFIRIGFDTELDELFNASENGQRLILDLENKEKERTSIKNLKIKYNKILGYFIDVTKSFVGKVPDDYIRKQTLVGSERYYTVELKELESKISGSKELALRKQQEILKKLRDKIYLNLRTIQSTAQKISKVDVLTSLANVANENNYVRPKLIDGSSLEIKSGRHPIVEALNKEVMFVPNDTTLNEEKFFNLITGPNMAGKSTYMRQVAIIVIMAHIGSFVPADEAKISIMDRVFTRIGASDNLAGGDSTFMVEMKEVSNILKHAKSNSLVILDEVGRGTSTFDGLSIAWAISEYIIKKIKSKTLFATHYHELTELSNVYDEVENLTIAVDKQGEDIVFLRKIINGFSSKSYGIEVAKLAGINEPIVERAKEILDLHESKENVQIKMESFNEVVNPNYDSFVKEISKIDINTISPLEALNLLGKIVEKASDINDN
ncbi:MAG: DNA mismatch repair protein MutS [Peptoniphilus sp.]|uniref:DNA mismatch repair protein MutS n=1 Tax=Peptoniphilus sp. TaxID=1971214 RepID=UPI002A75AB23|nr:DNA mismatch repair protein MutS [Peptoniphilus sp.]MDY2986960.1 DNA mismatch repair protein MutS [Peptoniphilus sp.]